jgi:integrase
MIAALMLIRNLRGAAAQTPTIKPQPESAVQTARRSWRSTPPRILPSHVRDFITTLQRAYEARPPTIRQCKVVLDAILTTALHEQVTFLHAGRGVKIPSVASKTRRIITVGEFARIHDALPDETMRLPVETQIESGLRWGELTELRVKDLDLATGMLTVSRAVVHLTSRSRPDGARFIVKDYPKDKE